MISALDHVQLAMPAGGERDARGFYSGLLGLNELEKPAPLAARGGVWFALPDGRQLHLGLKEPFRTSRKAHPAFVGAVTKNWRERWRRPNLRSGGTMGSRRGAGSTGWTRSGTGSSSWSRRNIGIRLQVSGFRVA